MAQNKKQAADMALKYRKEELLLADRFRTSRDLLEALLEWDQEYTVAEVEETINGFLKGKVK